MLRLFPSRLPFFVTNRPPPTLALSRPTDATCRRSRWWPRDDNTSLGLNEALSGPSTVPRGRLKRPYFQFPVIVNPSEDKRSFTLNTLNPERLTAKDLVTLTAPMPYFDIRLSSSHLDLTEISAGIDARTSKEDAEEPEGSSSDLSSPPADLSSSRTPATLSRSVEMLASTSRPPANGLATEAFPEGFGFLYYYTPPPHFPKLAGELRFRRIAPLGYDPRTWSNHTLREAFRKGYDHTIAIGLTWRVPLLTIGWARKYALVRAMLIHEGLVTEDTMDLAVVLGEEHNLYRHRSRILWSFGQPFLINFATRSLTFHFLGDESIRTEYLLDLCTLREHDTTPVQPFSGACVDQALCSVGRIRRALTPDCTYQGERCATSSLLQTRPTPHAGSSRCAF